MMINRIVNPKEMKLLLQIQLNQIYRLMFLKIKSEIRSLHIINKLIPKINEQLILNMINSN